MSVARVWAALGAGAGAVPVAMVLVIIGWAAVTYVRTDDFVVSMATWRAAAALAFGLATVAIVVGLMRAVVVAWKWPQIAGGAHAEVRLRWPRVETIALITLGLLYGAIVAYVFSGPEPCDDLPYGTDRTACAMGHGFLYVVLVLGGMVLWVLGSLVLSIVWIARTAWDAWTMLSRDG